MRTGTAGSILITSFCAIATIGGRPLHAAPGDNPVVAWNEFARSLHELAPSPLVEARANAVQHAAIHDALNTIHPRYERYTDCHGSPSAPGASAHAAIAQASRDVLAALWSQNPLAPPAAIARALQLIEEAYATALSVIQASPTAIVAGRLLGARCAAANLEKRATDGIDAAGPPFSATPVFVPGSQPGDYQFTPPNDIPGFAFAPGWGNVTPFAIDVDRHQPPGAPSLRSFAYAIDLNYLQAVGSSASGIRTPEQTEIARFWYELSPIGWNRIAALALRARRVGVWEAARILTLLNFALADGYTATFAAKYARPFWRPITAIRQAASDGNPFTHPDANWTPLCETPPIPEYPSTHTALGAAAAAVLSTTLGDHVTLATTSASLPGVTRRVRSFTQAAVENGLSRAYCGIHFIHAIADGYHQGWTIGRTVVRQLRPLR